MKLDFAQRCADKLVAWLTPHCNEIQVAGSIRRGRAEVGDIDLVVIPWTKPIVDLLGNQLGVHNVTADEIRRRIAEEKWQLDKDGPAYMVWRAATAQGIQVDLWFATRETWGSVLMCRTGSKEHNIWLASRAKRMGGHWHPHRGIFLGGRVVGETEEEIYQFAGVPFIPPERREAGYLHHLDPHAPLG
jgi:DNA polymerase (family 10)